MPPLRDAGYYTKSTDLRSDSSTQNMVRVGDELCAYLEKCGIGVVHDRTTHDKDYSGAYDHSRKKVAEYLEKYPSIEITIDVHRDDITYDNKTKVDALKHPNWNMGAKITIDSATLMNKGLELIEAVWLFGLPPEKIQIVVQRQSIVHSAVQFSDNSVIAQLGVPDMRIPIQYALTYPKRVPGVVPELDFAALKVLTFDVADDETFRCLAACKKAIKKGGLGPCAANGANEEAVKLFLEDKIGFLDIGRLVEAVVDSDSFGGEYTLSDVYECDRMAREFVRAHL